MKEEPVDSSYYRVLCEIWQRENQCKREDFNPRVVLFRADVETFWRQVGSSLPLIKEEPEEVAIKEEEEEEEEIFARSSACVKNEEEICTQSTVCVKHEEDVPLLLVHNTPDRDGFIRMLTFHRVHLQRPMDAEDSTMKSEFSTTQSLSLDHRVDYDSETTSDSDHRPVDLQKPSPKSRNKSQSGENTVMKKRKNSQRREQSKASDGATKASFECSDCGASFTFLANLRRHRKLRHSEERPFICTVCDKTFAEIYKLKCHLSSCDPGHFPYRCSVCRKGFDSNKKLYLHMLSHSEKHVCSECGKSFASKKNLKGHARIHTGDFPLSCSVCSKGFLGTFQLKIHMRTHTGERPFKCEECGFAFRQMKHYRNHMKTHSGEKPFNCTVCKRGFSRPDHVTSHMKVHRTTKHSAAICVTKDLQTTKILTNNT